MMQIIKGVTLQIGKLNHLVELWAYVETPDEFGEPIKNYTLVTKAWSEIRPLKGTETFNEKEVHTEHTHKIMMRYFDLDLDATMQIRYDKIGDGKVIRTFEVAGDPSDWMERDIFWVFNVKEQFEHDDIH